MTTEPASHSEPGIVTDRFMDRAPGPPPGDAMTGWQVEQVIVAFEGEGEGIEELTWGQQGLWDAMQRQRSWFPIGAASALPAGTTVEDVADQLRFLMSRYQTLRTRLRIDPNGTRQVVSPAGEVALDIVEAPEDADPEAVAVELRRHYSATDYDFVAQWPIRMGVVRHRGALTHLVTVICHLVADGAGISVMFAELAGRDPVTGEAAAPVTAMEPMEQARWQRSPAGKRQNEAGLRYCERVLRTVSARRFPEPTDRPRPRYWYGRFTSRALHLAVGAIAERNQVDTATVLLALFAIAQVRVTGVNPMMTMVVVSNRYRRGLATTVSPITQSVPCAIDVGDATVDEVVARTRGRAMAAYKYAYHDSVQFNQLVATLSRERGEEIDTACYLNDRRIGSRDQLPSPAPTPEQVTAAVAATSFQWRLKQDDEPYERFFLHLEDSAEPIEISLVIDTHHVSPADAEACLRGMQDVAVAAVTDPLAAAWTPPDEPSKSEHAAPTTEEQEE